MKKVIVMAIRYPIKPTISWRRFWLVMPSTLLAIFASLLLLFVQNNQQWRPGLMTGVGVASSRTVQADPQMSVPQLRFGEARGFSGPFGNSLHYYHCTGWTSNPPATWRRGQYGNYVYGQRCK